MKKAYIALENGEVITGRCRSPGESNGEIVFTTAYTGYEESLTDPSYKKQVLTFSYTLIGNYGVREDRFESDAIQPEAAIARNFTRDIKTWFDGTDKPAIDNIETRDIVRLIREEGAMKCGIAAGESATPKKAKEELRDCVGMSDRENINELAHRDKEVVYGAGNETDVLLVDCGAKDSIITSLVERNACVKLIPCVDATIDRIDELNPDIVFISNGPGDPAYFETVEGIVDDVIGDIPLAGICLGQQIIARGVGGETEKMEFGHRGVNQPVIDEESKQVVMTTQNHGYSVAEPGYLTVTQRNVNDDTIEGIGSTELDVITRQYHPEANPGPHDSLGFFDDVLSLAD